MDVKAAVEKAVSHINALFEQEGLTNVGLEEAYLETDMDTHWVITVGFSRPWDYPKGALGDLVAGRASQPKRSYKIVRIHDASGDVVSVRNWVPPSNDQPF